MRRLTADSGASLFPAISRDGKLVAYVSDRAAADSMDLGCSRSRGGDPVQLTRRARRVSRSSVLARRQPRSCCIAAPSPAASTSSRRSAGLPKQLAEGELPQFSPDGSQISYRASSIRQQYGSERSGSCLPLEGLAKEIKIGEMSATSGERRSGARTARGCSSSASAVRRTALTNATGTSCRSMTGAVAPTGARQRLEAVGLGPRTEPGRDARRRAVRERRTSTAPTSIGCRSTRRSRR